MMSFVWLSLNDIPRYMLFVLDLFMSKTENLIYFMEKSFPANLPQNLSK